MNATDKRLLTMADKRARNAKDASKPAPDGIFVKVEARMRESLAGLRGAPLSVLLYLGLRIGSNFMCNPSVRLIAVETGYSPATVRRALRLLQKTKYIDYESDTRLDTGGQSSNSYTVKTFFEYGRHGGNGNGTWDTEPAPKPDEVDGDE